MELVMTSPYQHLLSTNPTVKHTDIYDKLQSLYCNKEDPLLVEKYFTPIPLIASITARLPVNTSTSILVYYAIEWVSYLIFDCSVAAEKITLTTNKYDAKLAKQCALHGCNYTAIDVVTSRSKGKPQMKFDIIVGNPPFQDPVAKSSKKLWPEFVKTAVELVNPGGFFALITPSSWMSGNSEVYDILTKNQCVYLDPDCASFFPGVGSTFSAYVVQRIPSSNKTELKGGQRINLANMKSLPKGANPVSVAIFSKIAKLPTIDVKFDSFCHSQRNDRVSRVQTPEFKYPNKHGSNTQLWSNVPHPCSVIPKVMFYMSGAVKPVIDNGTFGITQHHAYVPCNINSAQNIVNYLTSKFVRFLIKESTYAQAWNKEFLKTIPAVDFEKEWTDAEIYQHFNLTQSEIDHIEQTVK